MGEIIFLQRGRGFPGGDARLLFRGGEGEAAHGEGLYRGCHGGGRGGHAGEEVGEGMQVGGG